MLMPRRTKGFSLVELMVSLTIGLFLLMGLLAFLNSNLSSSRSSFENSRISQELNAVMELMVRDIRRAGYSSSGATFTTSATAAANPFTQSAVSGSTDGGINIATLGCILYSYDMPGSANGSRDAAERLGFKLLNGVVYAAPAAGADSCGVNGWQPLTDPSITEVTALTFEYLDASNTVAATQKPIVAVSGSGWSLCTRNIKITLAGRLVKDNVATREVTQSVRVRNDWFKSSGSSC
jgi:prepilin peptidase dependent protein B